MLLAASLALVVLPSSIAETDLRTAYDVEAYDLELAVRPEEEVLEGVVLVTARASEALEVVRLDLEDLHEVSSVQDGAGRELEFERIEHGLLAHLARQLEPGEVFSVRVSYHGNPKGGAFDGFHWARSESGAPWINTACQGLGAHYWWPCKASFFHPEDKPERVSMAITCPAELYAVSNGKLEETREGAPAWFDAGDGAWKTYAWRHDYPLETYSVTLNVGPYVVVESELDVPGLEAKVPFIYYVLPENVEKAALQFQQVPELVRVYSEAFGPFPFPDSKFALVETNFWGMEHSTAVAYGSSYPAWCEREGVKDPWAHRNKWFDYILVHEVAHEWWGNAVSAKDWGHFWIHEGFGTYAEGVYLELTQGREVADRYFTENNKRAARQRGRLYRGESPTSGEAYSGLIYSKGAAVLNTLRHYVDDDEAWWASLREFQHTYRYGNATTEDFQAILERQTGRDWARFFEEWFYGTGSPELHVALHSTAHRIEVQVRNEVGTFHLPLDLAWEEAGVTRRRRLWIDPGAGEYAVECASPPSGVRVEHLERLLGRHEVE